MKNLPRPIDSDRNYLEDPLPEANEIYGGIASPALSPIPSPRRTRDTDSSHWSSSVQTLLDQPPASFPARLLVGGTLFCVVFGAWTWYARVEDVGRAIGKLVPEGDTYKVQPIEAGKVRRIEVKEGDTVKAGQVIAELDTTLAEKEVERLQQSLNASEIERVQKQGLLSQLDLQEQTRAAIADAEEKAALSAIALANARLDTTRQLLREQKKQLASYRERHRQLQPLPAQAKIRLAQLQNEKRANQERVDRLTPLVLDGAIAREMLFQAEQALRDTEQKITLARLQDVNNSDEQIFQASRATRDLDERIAENRGELATTYQEVLRLQAELTRKRAEARAARLENEQRKEQLRVDITKIEAAIADTKIQLSAARSKLTDRYLRSDVEGTILTLNLKNAGEVLQAGQTVAEIAPKGARLILKAELPNREAGSIAPGLPARVKFDAFPYQDYGVIAGEVTTLSADSKTDKERGEVYLVQISLEPRNDRAGDRSIRFKPGQTATAEIIIRRRRVIEVLLEPFKKLQQDGLTL